jgi:hypothetical protein
MNQIRPWSGKCQRCSVEAKMYTMSMFDVSLICMDCAATEKIHPEYSKAQKAECDAIKKGNTNFEGIGYPHTDIGNDPVDW